MAEIRGYWPVLIITFLILAGMASFLSADTYHGSHMDAMTAGQFGDFIGGCFGPIFSLIGILLLVVTIREQREAARDERLSDARQAVENKYFQLLSMHRDNVNQMEIAGSVKGQKVFVAIFNEVQYALQVIDRRLTHLRASMPLAESMQLAYYVVFFGIGPNSTPSLLAALRASEQAVSDERFLEILKGLQSSHHVSHPYVYFEGHQARLGHYYRHLYQMVSYVHEQDILFEKLEHTKTIRAQLSTHEQALLLINSLSALGWKWWKRDYLRQYKLVKNIPANFFAECGRLDATSLFPEDYFEFQENTERPSIIDELRPLTIQ